MEIEEYQHPDAALSLTIVASHRQQKNPLIEHIKELRVSFAHIVPDFLLSPTHCALFISLKYHRLHPDYLLPRIHSLKKHYKVRLLLCVVDLTDYDVPLENVTHLAFQGSMSLFLAWSLAEAGRIIEILKQWGDKPPDVIQGRLDLNMKDRCSEVLTTIPSINKVDSVTLIREFGTMKKLMMVINYHLLIHNSMNVRVLSKSSDLRFWLNSLLLFQAKKEDIAKCTGIGNRKLNQLWRAFHEPLGKPGGL